MGSRARCRRQQGEERGVRDRLFQQRAEPMLGGRGVVLCPQPRQLGFGSSGRDPLARSAPSRPGARHHDRPQHIGVGARVTSPWICLLELDPDERTPIDSECMRGAAGSRPKFCKRFATQTGRGYGPGTHRAGWATELRRVTSRTARRTPGVWGVGESRRPGIDEGDAQARRACGCPRGRQPTGSKAQLRQGSASSCHVAHRLSSPPCHIARALSGSRFRSACCLVPLAIPPGTPRAPPPLDISLYPYTVASPSIAGFEYLTGRQVGGRRHRKPHMSVPTPRSEEAATLSRVHIPCTRYACRVFLGKWACAFAPKEDT